jgi:hypothetical protein
MAFTPGQRIRASDLNVIGKLVARNSRTTNTAAINTVETAAISCRGAVTSGRSYLVTFQTEAFGSVAQSAAQLAVRYTTNDVEPTITSTQLCRMLTNNVLVAIPQTTVCEGIFDCTSTGFLRVLGTLIRGSGTGNVQLSASAAFPTLITIEDIGDTIASSGTIY